MFLHISAKCIKTLKEINNSDILHHRALKVEQSYQKKIETGKLI